MYMHVSNKLLSFALLGLITLPALHAGGSGGNGGDGVFCSWRKPLVLDYYASGFIGGILYGGFSPILDIYKTRKSIGLEAVEILEKAKKAMGPQWSVNGAGRTELEILRKGLSRSLKVMGDYQDWKQVDAVQGIQDSLHEDFLPQGCRVLQIANSTDKGVQVDKTLFEQLDSKQKELLALHESLYLLGRKSFNHQNSYLTRNLTRAILRYGGNPQDSELFGAVSDFILNKVPAYLGHIDENVPGSGTLNTWRLNVFDLQGEFFLENSEEEASCPRKISGSVSSDLKFTLSPFDFQSENFNYVTYLGLYVEKEFLKESSLGPLSLSLNDRVIPFDWGEEVYMMGLNRKDQFFLHPLLTLKTKATCFYQRLLPHD
jgi:hypothetical protein